MQYLKNAKCESITNWINLVLDKSGYNKLLNELEPERKENIAELIQSVKDIEIPLEEYLQEITLFKII